MLFSTNSGGHSIASWTIAVLSLLPTLCSASPTPVDIHITKKPQHDLIFREALEMAHQPHLGKRLQADFSLDRTWEKNHVLFAGSWISSDAALGVTDTVSLSVTCIDCWTKGTVSAKLKENIIDPSVRLDFSGVEAYVDVGVDITAGAAYAVNLFTSATPLGLGFPGLSVGLVFYVDLVFSLSSEIDLEGGFYVKVADGAFLEASVFDGDITDSFFDGLNTKSLPVVVRKGSATFKADLRLRVQCGAEAGVPEIGMVATAELGIYVNLIEFVAVLESTPTCALQSIEWWDLNVGAFARFGVVIDYKTFGIVPTVSTTLLTAPTLTQCWLERGPEASGTVVTVTTKPASLVLSSSVGASTSVGDGSNSYYESGGYGGHISGSTSVSTSGNMVASSLTPIVTTAPIPPSPPSSLLPSFPAGNSSTHPIYSTGGVIPSSPSPPSPNSNPINPITYSTILYTITSCAAAVPNCPTSLQSEIVVTKTIEIHPTASSPLPIHTSEFQTDTATVTVITDIIVLIPCQTPIVETYTPRAPTPATTDPASSASEYPTLPAKNGYLWPNGSSITTILEFSTLTPSDVISVGTSSVYAVPTEYPVLSSPSPTISAFTAGTSGVRGGLVGIVAGVIAGLLVMVM